MDELIRRLRERVADPKARTDAPQSVSFSGPGGTVTTEFGSLEGMLAGGGYGQPGAGVGLGGPGGPGALGALLADLQRVVDANQAGRPIDDDIRRRVDGMTAAMSRDNPNVPGMGPPATAAVLDAAEARLGFALPAALRRVYGEVGDGGFGPGGGLLPIERIVDEYLLLTAQPQGPKDQPWPAELLPIEVVDPGYVTLDVATGRVVDWDPEELTERSGDAAWRASFRESASSLEAWLEAWVGSRPAHEVEQERLDASMVDEARRSRAMIAAMTPEERAAMGLPEVGWEQVVWGGLGLDEGKGSR